MFQNEVNLFSILMNGDETVKALIRQDWNAWREDLTGKEKNKGK
jgi:hypothetical protein